MVRPTQAVPGAPDRACGLRPEHLKGEIMRDLRAAIRNQPPAEHQYDWDPLHTPGTIQPYGVLLVADAQSRNVLFASENTAELFGIPAADIIDRSYLALCDNERERRTLKESVTAETILFPNPVRITIKGKPFDAIFHAHNGEHLIEIEAADPDAAFYGDMADRAVEELFDPNSVEELYQRAVRVVREVTGFDRVMLYRFDARYNGQVLAEASREGIGSFLGLFFPSSDIGARARELYLKNFTRYIPDIGAAPVRLVGVHPGGGMPGSAHPVDMTFANLRSVVPCHITYLTNIGVRASMSFSINVDNRLWGLFACHHYKPKRVSYDQRVVCEQAAMMFIFKLNSLTSVAARLEQRARGVQQIGRSLAVGAALARRIASLETAWGDAADQAVAKPMVDSALAALHAQTSWLLAGDGVAPDETGAPTPQQQLLLDLVEADSAAVVRHGQIYRIGDAPQDMAIYAIASMFGRELPDLGHGNLPVFATDNLSAIAPVAEEIKDRAAGVMAVSLADDVAAYLLWFRREQIVHATWAGNPSAEAITGGAGEFNPRASFNAWKQDIRNLSRPWVIEDVEIAYDLANLIRGAAGGAPREAPPRPVLSAWQAPPPTPAPVPPPRALPAASQALQRRVIRVGQL
jgi:light-regulated signal transduction histidine kinase (bacteriophytochrome)